MALDLIGDDSPVASLVRMMTTMPRTKKLPLLSMGLPWWFNGKESACNAGDLGLMPGLGRSLEKGMATHSSILGLPGCSAGKESTCNAGDLSSALGWVILWRREELPSPVGMTEDEMIGWHHRLNGHEFKQTLGVVLDREICMLQSKGLQRVRHN